MAELKGLVLSLSQIHTSPRALLIAANAQASTKVLPAEVAAVAGIAE